MSQAQCEYCGQEERYGHNAICVMNTVEDLRAENERLRNELRRIANARQYDPVPSDADAMAKIAADAIDQQQVDDSI